MPYDSPMGVRLRHLGREGLAASVASLSAMTALSESCHGAIGAILGGRAAWAVSVIGCLRRLCATWVVASVLQWRKHHAKGTGLVGVGEVQRFGKA